VELRPRVRRRRAVPALFSTAEVHPPVSASGTNSSSCQGVGGEGRSQGAGTRPGHPAAQGGVSTAMLPSQVVTRALHEVKRP
jgi:hypothetical protein